MNKNLTFLKELTTLEHILFWGLLSMIFLSPVLFTTEWYTNFGVKTGPIGDTIGGLTAPFVNLLAAFLVYKSFKAQVKANSLQVDNHKREMNVIRAQFQFNTMYNIYEKFELNSKRKLDELFIEVRGDYIMFAKNLNEYLHNSILYPQNNSKEKNIKFKKILITQGIILDECTLLVDQMESYKKTNKELDFNPLIFFIGDFVINSFLNDIDYLALKEGINMTSPDDELSELCDSLNERIKIINNKINLLEVSL